MAELIKIKFIKSPTGKYRMAYNAGHSGLVPKDLGEKLIKDGFAVLVESQKVESQNKHRSGISYYNCKKNEALVNKIMGYVKVTSGPSTPILTTSEAKNYLKIDTSADDTLISDLVTAATDYCENYLGQKFITLNYSRGF